MSRTIAIYARQSIDKKDSLSIEGQIDLCKREAQNQQVVIYQDRGFSGKNTNRPDFIRMLNDVKSGKISKIICYRLDRISRSITDFGNIWQVLSANQVEFISLSEKFDTSSPMGRAMLYIIMVFAQLERETIAQRIKDNYYQRIKRGIWPGGPGPYGFEVKKEKGGKCLLSPTGGLETVKDIFRIYASPSASLGSVCQYLTDAGIPGPRREGWDSVAVSRLLHQPAYVKADGAILSYYAGKGANIACPSESFDGLHGCILVGKNTPAPPVSDSMSGYFLTVGQHVGIIDSQLFLRCQEKLLQNRQLKNTGKGKHTWLSGLLKCGECGYSLKVQLDSKSHKRFLVCSGRTNLHLCQHRHSERLEEIEAYISSRISPLMQSLPAPPAPYADPSPLYSRLASFDGMIQNLISSLAQGSPLSIQYINREIARLEHEKQLVQKQIDSLLSSEYIKAPVSPDFDMLPYGVKKSIASLLISRIECTHDLCRISWRF